MWLILIAIIVAAIIGLVLLLISDDGEYGIRYFIGFAFGIILFVGAGISALIYAFVGWEWFASEHKMHIVNREYNTHYTREEVFWASDVIDTIRELDRKRIELNGDLLQNEGNKESK